MYIVAYKSISAGNKKVYWKAELGYGVEKKEDATKIFDNEDAREIAKVYPEGEIEQIA